MDVKAVNRDDSDELLGQSQTDLNQPDSLFEHAKYVCFTNPRVLFKVDGEGALVGLRAEVCLPSLIADDLLLHYAQEGKVSDAFLRILGDTESVSLKCAHLHGCDHVSDDGLESLFRHKLQSLDISDCSGVTSKVMDHLLLCRDSLQHLNVDFCRGIITKQVMENFSFTNLSTLNMNSIQIVNYESHLVQHFFNQLTSLTSLDLSNQVQVHSTKSLDFLNLVAGQLKSLVLYNCKPKLITESWNVICSMTHLRHLDVSQEPSGMTFGQPRFHTNVVTPQMLSQLVDSVPNLRSLDISRHNLGSWDDELVGVSDVSVYVESSLPGLKRMKRPLEFLGMWMTRWSDTSASNEHARLRNLADIRIPALKSAGGVSKESLLTALEVYTEKCRRFLKVLNIYRRHPELIDCDDVMVRIVQSIFRAMSYHSLSTDLQVQCIEMLGVTISKYTEDGREFPKGKLYRQIAQAVIRSSAYPHCGQSFTDSVCEVFSLLKLWKNDFEYIPFVHTLFRLTTDGSICDMPDLFDLLETTITTADGDKMDSLIDSGIVKLTLTLMDRVIAYYRTDEHSLSPNDSIVPLNVGWHLLRRVASFAGGRRKFLSLGGASITITCMEHLLNCCVEIERDESDKNSVSPDDDCWCVKLHISSSAHIDLIMSIVSVVCNLVLDSDCQPAMVGLIDPLFALLTKSAILPVHAGVAFCVLSKEQPALWAQEADRQLMLDQVVEANKIRSDALEDTKELRKFLISSVAEI